jgi:signal transduction histidine kinase
MDADMVVRALENLAHNAIQYSPDGGEITLDVRHERDAVTIGFTNEGPGIAEQDIPFVFDPFVRGGKDGHRSGFGLGLATVESVITSHGWNIRVESEPGELTVFTIRIPLDDAK